MRRIIYNNKLKKILVSLLLIVLIIENMMPCLSFAFTTGTITLNQYILEMVKSWADEEGKIIKFIYADGYSYVNVNEIDIEYFWTNSLYDMPGSQKNDGNQGEIFEVKARKLIDSIIAVLKKEYEKSDGNNVDLNDCLYQLISDRREASNGFLGFGKKEAFNNGDDIKVTVSNGTISSIDLSAIAIESYEIVKKSNKNEENKELEEISDGVYKVDKDRYCCTYNVAEPIWNENAYLEELVKNYLNEFSVRNYDFKEVIAKYGNKIDYIAIYFNKIDGKGKPTGKKPGKLDIYININGLEIREEISSDERIQISEGIEQFKGTGQFFCTYNVAIKAWDEQYIKEQVQSKLKAICLDLEYDFDGIIKLYGDDNDKIRIYFKEIDSQNNPIGENPKSEDIEVKIKREELLDNKLTNFSEKTDSADIGGILLSPILGLFNFIADSIIGNLGNIMRGKGLTIFNGVLVSSTSEIEKKYKETSTIEINVESFFPTNFVSSLIGWITGSDANSKYAYPNINYSPEDIFSGEIDLLSIDFISGKNYKGEDNTDEGWKNIRKVISQWYQVLRMIAIIGLLSVLIYTGIKIILSANAKDKAKYKEWIINWLMAVAILFSMHYIMAFIVAVMGEFSKLMTEAFQGIHVVTSDGNDFNTNLIGLTRFMVQSENFYIKVGYEVMYIALIVYTIKFTFTYLKRVLNVAFLTLIAPIVALTYPIDKLNDGRAQGFEMWLKEYFFNALLQPMHCILYYVLVGTAADVAAKNPLYGIVVLAFMSEAEKLFKKIFGFDKAGGGTVGGMANAFAAGAIASNIAKMAKLPKGNAGKGGNGNSDSSNRLLENLKPEKDGPIEDNFATNLLNDGNQPNGDPANGDPANGDPANGGPTNGGPTNGGPTNGGPANGGPTNGGPTNGGPTNGGPTNGGPTNGGPTNGGPTNGGPANGGPANGGPTNRGPTNRGPTNGNPANGGPANRRQATGNPSPDNGEPIKQKSARMQAIRRGAGNVIKTLAKPVYDHDRRGTGYNKRRLKRRVINGLKGAGKLAAGAALGTAVAAVQAGISITDGKYNPMEGIASFAAGYAGGRGLASKAWNSVSEPFKEGYYEGDQEALRKKQKEQFMDSEENYKAYKNKYGDDAYKMQQLACDNMVPYGYTDVKEQFKIQKMANEIVKRNGNYANYSDDQKKAYMEKAIKQARNTKGFIDQLDSQGVKGIIRDPSKQDEYIKSELSSRGITDMNSAEALQIRTGLENAFKSAAVWQEVNKK